MPKSPLHTPVLAWYATNARDLPWRRPDASPWSVLVSEVMLQQTPVSRVLPAHAAWLSRWPTPSAQAADQPGEAVRQWGRLGYPRRALRLHGAATTISRRHDGDVPADYDELRDLPGIGDYTAAAVASFAFGRRHVVLDTNVRRVFARAVGGVQYPPTATTADRTPDRAHPAARRSGDSRPVGGGHDGARRAGVHRRRPTVRGLPDPAPLRLAARRSTGVRRTAPPPAVLRRHRPAVPRPAAAGTARGHRAGRPIRAGRGLVRGTPARARPGHPGRRRVGGAVGGRDVPAPGQRA